jgi:hypothetical protein
MIDIHLGDNDPKVVLVQLLLATRPPQASITIDGSFGQGTAVAVRAFQRANPPLAQTGMVDTATWRRLLDFGPYASVDHVDVDDLVVAMIEGRNIVASIQSGQQFGLVAANELARAGMPAQSASVGMSNGVSQMIDQVISARRGRRLALLRIFGHGLAGYQIVSAGHGAPGGATSHGSALTAQAVRVMRSDWGRLAAVFCRSGSAELHGCHVGDGAAGLALLSALADIWQVPVSASPSTQRTGRGETARFEGIVRTAFPGGGGLRSWAQRIAQTEGSSSRTAPA